MTASHARSQLRHRPVGTTTIVAESEKNGQCGSDGVECPDVARARPVCWSEYIPLEICRRGLCAGVAGAIGIPGAAGACERGAVHYDQCSAPLFQRLLPGGDFL